MSQKILVAEDDRIIQQLLVFKLTQNGFKVCCATDGESAYNLAEKEKPDMIMLDYMMPVMDGFQVLRRLKENPELKDIPVVMLTARAKDQDIVTGLDLGAADYMIKPFSPAELMARVRKVLRTPASS